MSIMIKGIDMPKCLNDDILVVIRRDKAEVLQTGYKERIVEAIQIPTPHGRIIDEDEIYEQPHCGECNDATLDAIHNAPTILEEEP